MMFSWACKQMDPNRGCHYVWILADKKGPRYRPRTVCLCISILFKTGQTASGFINFTLDCVRLLSRICVHARRFLTITICFLHNALTAREMLATVPIKCPAAG